MMNLVEDGETWMKPLLEIRNYLHMTTIPENKSKFRDFKGRNGRVRWKNNDSDVISRGPYTLNFCRSLFKKLLEAQLEIEKAEPGTEFKIINEEEIHEIRRLWITERGDWEDSIPKIYKGVLGKELNWIQDDKGLFNLSENELLRDVCKRHKIPTELVVNLLDVERKIHGMTRRSLVYSKLDSVLKKEWRSEDEVLQKKIKEKTDGFNILR